MSTYTKQQQRYLDQASGDDLDRRANKYLCATCGDKGWVYGGTARVGGPPASMTARPCPACDGNLGKPAYSDYLNRPTRSKEAVALDLAVDALATARTKLLSFKRLAPNWTSIDQVIEKVDRALFGIAELRK